MFWTFWLQIVSVKAQFHPLVALSKTTKSHFEADFQEIEGKWRLGRSKTDPKDPNTTEMVVANSVFERRT